jgi:hypothetical protein
MTGKSQRLRYRTLRALRVFNYLGPGVPLRSTPGRGPRPSISAGVLDFMLPPAARVGNASPH